jgi:hypothetical protein
LASTNNKKYANTGSFIRHSAHLGGFISEFRLG